MNRIIYVSAGSRRWGMGHLKRSAEIIALLKQQGREIYPLAYVPADDDHAGLVAVLGSYDKKIHSWEEQEFLNAKGYVVDLPLDLQESFLAFAKKNFQAPVFAIEWYPPSQGMVVDTVNLRDGREGLQFAIIRREILEVARGHKNVRYDCVIMLGGMDQKGHLQKILHLFLQDHRLSGLNAAFILGPMDEAPLPLVQNRPGIDVYKNPPDLAQLLACSRIGLSNAGSSLMEMCALGIPTIIFPQTDLEQDFAQVFLNAGCSVAGEFKDDHLVNQIDELCRDEKLCSQRSLKARSLIDGQGAQRIVNRINKVFTH